MSSFLLVMEYGTIEISIFKIDTVILIKDELIVRLEQQRNPKC